MYICIMYTYIISSQQIAGWQEQEIYDWNMTGYFFGTNQQLRKRRISSNGIDGDMAFHGIDD